MAKTTILEVLALTLTELPWTVMPESNGRLGRPSPIINFKHWSAASKSRNI